MFVAAPCPSRSLVQVTSTSSASRSRASSAAACSSDGASATTTMDVPAGEVRADRIHRPLDIGRPVRGHQDHAWPRPIGGSSSRDGTLRDAP